MSPTICRMDSPLEALSQPPFFGDVWPKPTLLATRISPAPEHRKSGFPSQTLHPPASTPIAHCAYRLILGARKVDKCDIHRPVAAAAATFSLRLRGTSKVAVAKFRGFVLRSLLLSYQYAICTPS